MTLTLGLDIDTKSDPARQAYPSMKPSADGLNKDLQNISEIPSVKQHQPIIESNSVPQEVAEKELPASKSIGNPQFKPFESSKLQLVPEQFSHKSLELEMMASVQSKSKEITE